MKKFLAILLALTFCITCFAACDDKGNETTVSNETDDTSAPVSDAGDVAYGNETFTTVKVGTGSTTGTNLNGCECFVAVSYITCVTYGS